MDNQLPDELLLELENAGWGAGQECPVSLGCCVPDLSELIEACGASIDKIQFEVGYVEAFGRAPTKKSQNFTRARGENAAEAVARLWLVLRKGNG